MDLWGGICRYGWMAIFVLVVVHAVLFLIPKYEEIQEKHRIRLTMQEENRKTEADITELRIKQDRFATDPSFVERVARENEYVKPDETVFKFVNAPTGEVHAAGSRTNRTRGAR